MTTVGYGDKSPKSIPARLFSIIWIYTGIVIFGIIAASLTAVIIDGATPQPASMGGKRVGMMPYRIYDANIIAENGGTRIPATRCPREVISIYRMLEQLKDGEIDGFLLDKYTFWEWTTMFDKYPWKAENVSTCEEIRKIASKKYLFLSQNSNQLAFMLSIVLQAMPYQLIGVL